MSKGAIDMKQLMQSIHTKKPKQISAEIKLCVIKWNDTGKTY